MYIYIYIDTNQHFSHPNELNATIFPFQWVCFPRNFLEIPGFSKDWSVNGDSFSGARSDLGRWWAPQCFVGLLNLPSWPKGKFWILGNFTGRVLAKQGCSIPCHVLTDLITWLTHETEDPMELVDPTSYSKNLGRATTWGSPKNSFKTKSFNLHFFMTFGRPTDGTFPPWKPVKGGVQLRNCWWTPSKTEA